MGAQQRLVIPMAIMTVPNKANGVAQDLMQAVARAVIADHEARRGG